MFTFHENLFGFSLVIECLPTDRQMERFEYVHHRGVNAPETTTFVTECKLRS
jgi:hypothetical protein